MFHLLVLLCLFDLRVVYQVGRLFTLQQIWVWPQWPDSVPLSQRRAGNIRSWEIFIWMLIRYKLLAIIFSKTPEILGYSNQPLWGHSLYHWKVTDIKKDLKSVKSVSSPKQLSVIIGFRFTWHRFQSPHFDWTRSSRRLPGTERSIDQL